MAGIVPAVHALVTVAAVAVAVTAKPVLLKTALVMVIAAQSPGLVMVLPIVKIRLMDVI